MRIWFIYVIDVLISPLKRFLSYKSFERKNCSLTGFKVETEISVHWSGCCLTPESPERLEVGQKKPAWTTTAPHRRQTLFRSSARGTQSVHWYSRIWPTDNRDVTGVKTAGPLQIMLGRKARGVPRPSYPTPLCCHGDQISPVPLCHTHVDTFFL